METFSLLLALCAGNSPVNFPHKGQWRGSLVFVFICAWINGWVNNREAGDLRCHCAHYEVIVMLDEWMKQMTQFLRGSWATQVMNTHPGSQCITAGPGELVPSLYLNLCWLNSQTYKWANRPRCKNRKVTYFDSNFFQGSFLSSNWWALLVKRWWIGTKQATSHHLNQWRPSLLLHIG